MQFCFYNKKKKQNRIAELRPWFCVHLHTLSSAHKMVKVKTTWVEVTCAHGYYGLLQVKGQDLTTYLHKHKRIRQGYKGSMLPHLLTANWHLQYKKKAVCHHKCFAWFTTIYKICQALTQSCWLRRAAPRSFRHQQQHISRGGWREKREDLILNDVLHSVSFRKQNCAEYCNALKPGLLQPSNRPLFEQFQKTNVLW